MRTHEFGIFRGAEDQEPFGEGHKGLLLSAAIAGGGQDPRMIRARDRPHVVNAEDRDAEDAGKQPLRHSHVAPRVKASNLLSEGS